MERNGRRWIYPRGMIDNEEGDLLFSVICQYALALHEPMKNWLNFDSSPYSCGYSEHLTVTTR